MKKKMLCIVMLLLLMILMIAAPALATESTTDIALDWSSILSRVIGGVLSVLLGGILLVAAYVLVRYVVPNLPAIVKWLKDKRMLWLAKILVNAAEVALGRYFGAEKRELVKQWFKDRGIEITEDVEIMISKAWQELNDSMIEHGLKEPVIEKPPSDSAAVTPDAFDGTEEPVVIQ